MSTKAKNYKKKFYFYINFSHLYIQGHWNRAGTWLDSIILPGQSRHMIGQYYLTRTEPAHDWTVFMCYANVQATLLQAPVSSFSFAGKWVLSFAAVNCQQVVSASLCVNKILCL